MKDKRPPQIASSSNPLVKATYKLCGDGIRNANTRLNHWKIEEDALQNIDIIKNTIPSKFQEKLWCDK